MYSFSYIINFIVPFISANCEIFTILKKHTNIVFIYGMITM